MQPTSRSFPANARAGLADPILQQALGLARTGFPQRRLEAIARYLVQPKQAGRIKNRMTRNMLAALRKEPDRVKFPRGDLR